MSFDCPVCGTRHDSTVCPRCFGIGMSALPWVEPSIVGPCFGPPNKSSGPDVAMTAMVAELARLQQENARLQAVIKELQEQNAECHQPAANYELLLCKLKGEPTNFGNEPVAKRLDQLQGDVYYLGHKLDTMTQELDAAHADVTRLEAERREVYGMGESPVEQAEQVPFVQWIKTRMVTVRAFNDAVGKLQADVTRLEAQLADAQRCAGQFLKQRDDQQTYIDKLTEERDAWRKLMKATIDEAAKATGDVGLCLSRECGGCETDDDVPCDDIAEWAAHAWGNVEANKAYEAEEKLTAALAAQATAEAACETWAESYRDARDAILNERGAMAEMDFGSDRINAVLAELDDRLPPQNPGSALLDRLERAEKEYKELEAALWMGPLGRTEHAANVEHATELAEGAVRDAMAVAFCKRVAEASRDAYKDSGERLLYVGHDVEQAYPAEEPQP